MLKFRTQKPVTDPGCVITQPNQSFTVRQIIDQFSRGELIPTQYSPTDSLGDNVDDDDVDDIIEFEDPLDAEAHLVMNQYKLFENEFVSSKEQESPPEVGKGSDSNSDQSVD